MHTNEIDHRRDDIAQLLRAAALLRLTAAEPSGDPAAAMVTARLLEIVARIAGRNDRVRDDLLPAAADLARYVERRAADPAERSKPRS